MQSLTDWELVARFVAGGAGGENAFAEIVRRHSGLVYGVCQRQLEPGIAEDAVQAVFMLLARKAHALGRQEALAGWLYGAASLVAREHLRAVRRRARAEKAAAAMRQAEEGRLQGDRAAAGCSGGASWGELRPEIDAALGTLPRPYRDVLLLSCLEGKPEREVALELGIPLGTVKSRVSRGLERLRERLKRRGLALSAVALLGHLGAHGSPAVPPGLAAKLAGLGTAAATVTGFGIDSASLTMMEGAMRAMFWMKVKCLTGILLGLVCVGLSVAVNIAGAQEVVAPDRQKQGAEIAPEPRAEAVAAVKSVVPKRMVCSKECQAKLDLANGIHKCSTCEGRCNSVHKHCSACAARLAKCEICGTQMMRSERASAIPELVLTLKPTAASFAENAPLLFELSVQNATSKKLLLNGIDLEFKNYHAHVHNAWKLSVETADRQKSWQLEIVQMLAGGPCVAALDPGKSLESKIMIDELFAFRQKNAAPIKHLPAGKYRLVATPKFGEPGMPLRQPDGYQLWRGELPECATEFQIDSQH